jgi:hypothetical protein
VVDPVGARNPAEVPEANEKPHRETPVNEAIVDHEIRDPEEAHADPGAEGCLAQHAGCALASDEDEGDRKRRVEDGERVVRLEPGPTWLRRVVRAVHGPEPRVPHASVEERRPEIHRDGDHDGDRNPDERPKNEGAHGFTLGGMA